MKEAAFRELVASVRQAGRIRRGARKPSRTFTFRPADVKTGVSRNRTEYYTPLAYMAQVSPV